MRGLPKPRPVEDLLPEVWQVVEELRELTEGLEAALEEAARDKEVGHGSDD